MSASTFHIWLKLIFCDLLCLLPSIHKSNYYFFLLRRSDRRIGLFLTLPNSSTRLFRVQSWALFINITDIFSYLMRVDSVPFNEMPTISLYVTVIIPITLVMRRQMPKIVITDTLNITSVLTNNRTPHCVNNMKKYIQNRFVLLKRYLCWWLQLYIRVIWQEYSFII